MNRRRSAPMAILAALGIITGCHELGGTPELKANLGDTDLALSCAGDLTCAEGVCDPATLACVDCVADSDCETGRCHPRDHVCVQCVSHDDCDEGFCHPTRAVCVGCFEDAQCRRGGSGVCHPDELVCVECTADRDCGNGRCNPETLACVGQCETDAQCADRNACTIDRCVSGSCAYAPAGAASACDDGIACTVGDHCAAGRCVGEATDACCESLACKPDQQARDADGDGCNDVCACPPATTCPVGTTPLDSNRGGCDDRCTCASGAIIEPAGECPCATGVSCDGGLVPSDLDGDGCADACAKPCRSACDCQAQGLVADTPCPLACANCGPFLECAAGACVGRCGVVPDNRCECPAAPGCGPLETAYDSDADGCNDACRCLVEGPDGCACLTAITCDRGASPVDTDRDGCPDSCQCDDAARFQRPDGSCCPPLVCPLGQIPTDVQGDTCADVCACRNGDAPSFAPPACPCEPIECATGSAPVDTDQDHCPDACVCDDGARPGPDGCAVCLADCSDRPAPAWLYFVDEDGDGCYETTRECPVGQTASASPGAGCPDFCAPCQLLACPAGARGRDSDGDRCPDLCVCDDLQPAPPGGCGCRADVACGPSEVPIDIDRDGCVDTCRTPCQTACDCGAARLGAACDCVDCRVTASCVDGFCASTCGASSAACLTPAVGDQVCGCDGKTYASRCEAGAAGVDVEHAGLCGTQCAADDDCRAQERCESERASCDAFAPVTRASCVAIPSSCLPADAPVCGCDGKTYANDCERLRANVARGGSGPCGGTP